LNWHILEDRGKDAQLVMMYKIANKNVAIVTEDKLKIIAKHAFFLFHSLSLLVRLTKTIIIFP
jgi:hypothetical protein